MKLTVDIRARAGSYRIAPRLDLDGEIAVLCGPSGSGKTLTLSAIVGALKPDEGLIRAGDDVYFDSSRNIDLQPALRRIGYVPQSYALFPHLTAAGNVAFGLTGVARDEARREVERMLALFKLEQAAALKPRQLSGGQQQRVALARALAVRPRLLLLDEPFAALDPALRGEMRALLRSVQRELRVAVVLVSHDVADAHALGDVVAVMDHGVVLQQGSRDAVFHRPASVGVARWTGARNLIPVRVVTRNGQGVKVAAGGLALASASPAPDTDDAVAVLRPERLRLLSPEDTAHGAETVADVRVMTATPQGAHWTVLVSASDDAPAIEVDVPAWWCERHAPAPGSSTRLAVPASAVHLIAGK